MCLAKAYAQAEDGERLIMENVTKVDIDGDTLTIRSLFGGSEVLRGRIASIDFAENRLVVQNVEG